MPGCITVGIEPNDNEDHGVIELAVRSRDIVLVKRHLYLKLDRANEVRFELLGEGYEFDICDCKVRKDTGGNPRWKDLPFTTSKGNLLVVKDLSGTEHLDFDLQVSHLDPHSHPHVLHTGGGGGRIR